MTYFSSLPRLARIRHLTHLEFLKFWFSDLWQFRDFSLFGFIFVNMRLQYNEITLIWYSPGSYPLVWYNLTLGRSRSHWGKPVDHLPSNTTTNLRGFFSAKKEAWVRYELGTFSSNENMEMPYNMQGQSRYWFHQRGCWQSRPMSRHFSFPLSLNA